MDEPPEAAMVLFAHLLAAPDAPSTAEGYDQAHAGGRLLESLRCEAQLCIFALKFWRLLSAPAKHRCESTVALVATAIVVQRGFFTANDGTHDLTRAHNTVLGRSYKNNARILTWVDRVRVLKRRLAEATVAHIDHLAIAWSDEQATIARASRPGSRALKAAGNLRRPLRVRRARSAGDCPLPSVAMGRACVRSPGDVMCALCDVCVIRWSRSDVVVGRLALMPRRSSSTLTASARVCRPRRASCVLDKTASKSPHECLPPPHHAAHNASSWGVGATPQTNTNRLSNDPTPITSAGRSGSHTCSRISF